MRGVSAAEKTGGDLRWTWVHVRVGTNSVIRLRGAPGVELLAKMTAEKPVAGELLKERGKQAQMEKGHVGRKSLRHQWVTEERD